MRPSTPGTTSTNRPKSTTFVIFPSNFVPAGISAATARRLAAMGVAGIDVAGELAKLYSNNCHVCHKEQCICTFGTALQFREIAFSATRLDAMADLRVVGRTIEGARARVEREPGGQHAAVVEIDGRKWFVDDRLGELRSVDDPSECRDWLAEQALNWSGLPVVHVRPTVFMENFFRLFAADSVRESDQIRLPLGEGKTSPVAVEDVARVLATLLANPLPHIGKIYHLTGPQSENMHFYAQEYSKALGRRITYQDTPVEPWREGLLTAVQNSGAGVVSRRSNFAAHRCASLRSGEDRGDSPFLLQLCREAEECAATCKNGPMSVVRY